MRISSIDIYDCPKIEGHWEIVREDGNIEEYTVVNDTYHYGRHESLLDRGVTFWGDCIHRCRFYLEIFPTDLRYNGAQITGVFNLPECFSSANVTDTLIINIQGIET